MVIVRAEGLIVLDVVDEFRSDGDIESRRFREPSLCNLLEREVLSLRSCCCGVVRS